MDQPIERAWWLRGPWLRVAIGVGIVALIIASAILLLGHPDRTLRDRRGQDHSRHSREIAFHDFIPLRANVVALNAIYLDALEGGRVERRARRSRRSRPRAGQRASSSSAPTELELDVLDREGRLIESSRSSSLRDAARTEIASTI